MVPDANTRKRPAAVNTVEATIVVDVPVRVAYNQWTQLESFPRFAGFVKDVDQLRPNLTRWIIGYGPLRHSFDAEILEQVPDSHVAWRSLDRRAMHSGRVAFRQTAAERTEIAVVLDIEASGFGMAGRIPGLAQRELERVLANFKELVESVGQSSGGWRGTIRNGRVQPRESAPPRSRVPHWPVG